MAGYIGKAKSLAVLAEQDPSIPSQTGNSGKYLTTDGTDASWATVEALPDAIDVNASAPADSLAIDSSGNVGVGTDSPTQLLHVNGDTRVAGLFYAADGTEAAPSIRFFNASTGMYHPGSDALGFVASGAERMRINSSGNVGIGTASPTKPLHIYGNTSNNHQIRLQNDFGSGADWTLNAYGANGNLYIGNNLDRLVVDSTGNLQFNSGYGSAATAYGCRAWVNFNGTGTVSIRASGGVSSITDNGTGDYIINLSTTMPDANYNAVAMGRTWPGVQSEGFVIAFGNYAGNGTSGRTTTYLRISSLNQVTNKTDSPYVGVSFFR